MSGALMTLCEQALSDRGKEKRAFNRKKPSAESGSGKGRPTWGKGRILIIVCSAERTITNTHDLKFGQVPR